MNGISAMMGRIVVFTFGVMIWASGFTLGASEANATHTSGSERWITNVIGITMPTYRFVNEYHTNWSMQTITNPVMVEACWTNTVVEYRTNWITRTQIKPVNVTVFQTNLVNRYRTNWDTLTVTNWKAVVLFKTNWVTVPVTNVVEVEVAARRPAPAAESRGAAVPEATLVAPAAPASAGAWKGPLVIEAARTARPPADNQVEVQLRVRRNGGSPAPLQVQSWRIEGEGGEVFLIGQEQEFKRQWPVGNYKVEVRLKSEADNSPTSVRGTLSLTARDAIIQPRLLVRK